LFRAILSKRACSYSLTRGSASESESSSLSLSRLLSSWVGAWGCWEEEEEEEELSTSIGPADDDDEEEEKLMSMVDVFDDEAPVLPRLSLSLSLVVCCLFEVVLFR
jgi:hypothetical protein